MAGVARALSSILDPLGTVIIAPECAACGRPLDAPSGGPVCAPCWAGIQRFTPPLCQGCGDPLPSGPRGDVTPAHAAPMFCGRCLRSSRVIDRAAAIGPYDGRLRDIIHAFKYDKRRTLGGALARLMRAAGQDVLAGADAVVPVPLHWARRHERGFNQAELLAAGLGFPVRRALRRVRRTRSQVELPAAGRRVNVVGAFSLAWRDRWRWARTAGLSRVLPLDGLTVVLVDDVTTTGATLDACAQVLKAAGAREVRALTAARVVSPPR